MTIATATEQSPVRRSANSVVLPRSMGNRVKNLLEQSYPYMDSSNFRKHGTEQELFSFATEPQLPGTRWYQPTREDLLDSRVTRAPQFMDAREERLMFLRFNFAKFRLGQLQKQIQRGGLTRKLAEDLPKWHRRFEHFREYLVRSNLALVLAMAKRVRLGDVDFSEVVSEGNMALIRAIDKFDVERGFKFSTYACNAILKAFCRATNKAVCYRNRFPAEFAPGMEKCDWPDRRRDQVEEECVDELKTIIDGNLANLSIVEQTVIRRRFNLQERDPKPLTREEVGNVIGLTKERVRQIQNNALAKIKAVMEKGILRTRRPAMMPGNPRHSEE
jgi:RNA polymerase primary sigma factor